MAVKRQEEGEVTANGSFSGDENVLELDTGHCCTSL